jgi:tetratricopeptide (TPR) repeat protein
MNPTTDRRRRTSRGRRALLQIAAGLGALLLLEGVLRLAGWAPPSDLADPYVGFTSTSPLFVLDDSGERLVTAPGRSNHFNAQSFPRVKPAGTTRIFCLGGSTTYGRPYTDSTSFPGWLRELLPMAAPGRSFEVINAGGISYASYRVAVVMEELAAYEPDLFVVYTGHNEFLEARTYGDLLDAPSPLISLGGLASRTAVFHALRTLAGTAPGPDEAQDGATDPEGDGRTLLPQEVATLLDGSVGPEAYHRDDTARTDVLAHLADSLDRMVDMAEDVDAGLVLVTPASELLDCRPFKSEHGQDLSAETVTELEDRLAAVVAGGASDLDALREIVAADPRHAQARYLLGEALLASGDEAGARESLVAARDEDVVPLRAGSDVLAVVHAAATDRGVPLLDWVARVDELARLATGTAIPGDEQFLDHVHMTPAAYRDLALQLIDVFDAQGWIEKDDGFDDDAVAAIAARVEASLDTEAHVRALARLAQVLDWAGKRQEAAALNDKALSLSGGGDAMSLWLQGNHRQEEGDLIGAEQSYRAALGVDPDYLEARYNLGQLLLSLDRLDEAAAQLAAALVLDPRHAPSHFAQGIVLSRSGNTSGARNAWRRVVKLDPAFADAHNQLGVSYLLEGDVERAEGALRNAVLADPTSARSHHNLGILLSETGRVEQARDSFQQAVALDPDRASSRHKLGMALIILGQSAEGVAELERAVQLAPDDQRIRRDLEQGRIRAGFGG